MPLTGAKLVTQLAQKFSAEQSTQLVLVVLQRMQALPSFEGTRSITVVLHVSQTWSALQLIQSVILQAVQVLLVVLRVKLARQATQEVALVVVFEI